MEDSRQTHLHNSFSATSINLYSEHHLLMVRWRVSLLLHNLFMQAIDVVGDEDVALGALSQGSTTTLVSFFNVEG